jgi:ferritin
MVTKDDLYTTDGVILETEINKKIDSTTDKELKELVKELIKQNGELVKTINEIVPKIGNTNITNNNNNNFNLNVFLNEQCKDALNISDFIDSLKITLEDLLFSKTNGISRGITDVMIKGLKELDINKRPIHCTDIKRDIMYIKNEDNWSKDDNHEIMKNTIVKIADKERTALQQWAIDNPDWIETERKQLEYLTMMRSICEPIENYNNYERKIIKILSKEIQVDKKVNNE